MEQLYFNFFKKLEAVFPKLSAERETGVDSILRRCAKERAEELFRRNFPGDRERAEAILKEK